ncbi:MAG: flagellar brake protein [Gammaproteobacteria bacterium]|nr:flagellar brake protein [Gammaproteobacteria bacterium]
MENELIDGHQKLTGEERDNLSQYLIKGQDEIIRSLRLLIRKPEPLTLFFDGGKRSFPTSVVQVISNRDLVVLERSVTDTHNDRLLELSRCTVVGQPQGVKIRFVLQGLSMAKFQNERVLIAPLPREYYRFQKREFFRVETPFLNPVRVQLTLESGLDLEFRASDMSGGGLRLDDVNFSLEVETMQIISNCTIIIPDMLPFKCDLEVRNSYEIANKNGTRVHYVGCAFMNLRVGYESMIQNYLNHLQLAQRSQENNPPVSPQ